HHDLVQSIAWSPDGKTLAATFCGIPPFRYTTAGHRGPGEGLTYYRAPPSGREQHHKGGTGDIGPGGSAGCGVSGGSSGIGSPGVGGGGGCGAVGSGGDGLEATWLLRKSRISTTPFFFSGSIQIIIDGGAHAQRPRPRRRL